MGGGAGPAKNSVVCRAFQAHPGFQSLPGCHQIWRSTVRGAFGLFVDIILTEEHRCCGQLLGAGSDADVSPRARLLQIPVSVWTLASRPGSCFPQLFPNAAGVPTDVRQFTHCLQASGSFAQKCRELNTELFRIRFVVCRAMCTITKPFCILAHC